VEEFVDVFSVLEEGLCVKTDDIFPAACLLRLSLSCDNSSRSLFFLSLADDDDAVFDAFSEDSFSFPFFSFPGVGIRVVLRDDEDAESGVSKNSFGDLPVTLKVLQENKIIIVSIILADEKKENKEYFSSSLFLSSLTH
jgi:hypothetical protein